jgi:16S rRNA (guanine966-N2)-methyltransferase
MKNRRPAESRGAAPGRVRIIAGRLRGSRIDVPELPGLRPTSDRVRETLFNWLAADLPGADCIDLFAGSGALGFEAASRGAARVLMLERDARVAAALRATAQRLQADAVEVVGGDALAWLASPPLRRFGVAFVDPPFDAGLLDASLAALDPWLAPGALVYVECAGVQQPAPPAAWTPHREGRTRDVRYALYRRAAVP